MAIKLQTVDETAIERIRAEKSTYLGPTLLGVAATLTSSAIFSVAALTGCRIGVGCSFPGLHDPLLQASTLLVPAAAALELAACIALVVDRSRARDVFFTRIALAGMIAATLVFATAALQWFLAHDAYAPGLASKTGRGVVLLGHGAWASILAFLAGSPVDPLMVTIGDDEVPSPIVASYDEKTPLRAILVPNAPRL